MHLLNFVLQLSDEDVLFVFLQRCSIFIWIIAILQFFLLELAPFSFMNTLTLHGKLRNFIAMPEKIDYLMVSKSYFMHFYLVGFLLSVSLATYVASAYSISETLQTFGVIILFSLHCWRRYLECLYITIYGDSKIHIVYLIGGMAHYVFVNISLWAAALEERQRAVKLSHQLTIVIALLLYILSTLLQFHSHSILYQLKLSITKKNENDSATVRYPLPKGGGFDFCVCPHYLAEIGIYLSFALLTNWSAGIWMLFIWVVCNLSYTASQHFSYYIKHYCEELEKRRLAILCPFLW